MDLASILPPATFGVVSWPNYILDMTQVENLDTSQAAWTMDNTYAQEDNSSLPPDAPVLVQPAPLVLSIASESAETINIILLKPPAVNSSYNLQFDGPSFQFREPEGYESQIFDDYIGNFAMETSSYPSTETYAGFDPSGKTFPDALLYSAFSLSLLNYTTAEAGSQVDSYNNWVADVPFESFNTSSNQQIWIQTYHQSIICTQVRASFDVYFDYVDGVQNILQYRPAGPAD
jgi:hypothetical protein